MLELGEEVVLVVLALQKRRKRRSRRVWVHPIVSARLTHGSFYTLYRELKEDNKNFFNYFRMSIASFDELYCTLKGSFSGRDTTMRRYIPTEERIVVTLR
jgi:hypothetical protein